MGPARIQFSSARQRGKRECGAGAGLALMGMDGRAGSPLPAAARTECAPYRPRRTQCAVWNKIANAARAVEFARLCSQTVMAPLITAA